MNIAIIKVQSDLRTSIGNIPCPDGKANVIPYNKDDQRLYDRIAKVPGYRVEKCKNPVGMYNIGEFDLDPPDKPKATPKAASKKSESEGAE